MRSAARVLAIIFVLSAAAVSAFPFRDVSQRAGIDWTMGAKPKYGGAAVADLDGDGYPDFLFGHHDAWPIEMYINNRDGTFSKIPWRFQADVHGINPFRFSPWSRQLHFSVSVGGSNGNHPKGPEVFTIVPDPSITRGPKLRVINVSPQIGLSVATGRGRSALFLSLRDTHVPSTDVLVTNARAINEQDNSMKFHQKALAGVQGTRFELRNINGYEQNLNWYVATGDLTGTGKVDVISFHNLQIFRVSASFTLTDVSSRVLPSNRALQGTVGVCVLDFNNDGWWDLFAARTNTGDLKWIRTTTNFNDVLLRGGRRRLRDVTQRARIPVGSSSRGVTCGDFNNDGWVDILVSRRNEFDILLLNNGDGTFTTHNAGFNRAPGVSGDMVTAVDYDLDGRLDVVVSEGTYTYADGVGFYRLMRNIGNHGNALLVRVRNSLTRRATSTHAVVRVKRDDGLSMMRMVGSPGTAVSNSLIETVHFGLANSVLVRWVIVTWIDGSTERRDNVRIQQGKVLLLDMGVA